ncbi:MAG: CPBP family intramembrane glutamic endopeptidase [Candidatus Cyclobacteriaceae bacterium M3_2C_046]
MLRNSKVFWYFLLVFTINWSIALVFYWSGNEWTSSAGSVTAIFYMVIPALVVFILSLFHKDSIKEQYGVHFKFNKWYWIPWLGMPILPFATLAVSLLFPQVTYSPDLSGFFARIRGDLSPEQFDLMKTTMDSMPVHPIWINLLQGWLAGITINAIAAFGEELGWRGYLFYHLRHLKFWPVSILIGFIWGIWHAPIILMGHNYPDHPVVGMFMMIAWCILLSPLFSYIRLKSGSVIAVSIMHGTLNGTVGLALMLIQGGSDLIVGVTGISGFVVLIMANLLLYFLEPKTRAAITTSSISDAAVKEPALQTSS